MHTLLLWQSEDPTALWIWLLVFLIPMLGRLAGWVIEKLGGSKSEDVDPRARQARAERARELERRGQEVWQRMLGSEPADEAEELVEEPAAGPRPAEVARAKPRPAALEPIRHGHPHEGQLPHDELPSTDRVPTLERQLVASRPSESMPELTELAQHRRSDLRVKADLDADEDTSELERVQYLEALASGSTPRVTPGRRSAIGLPRDRNDWRQAVVWSEILRPPVGLRDPEMEDLPALR